MGLSPFLRGFSVLVLPWAAFVLLGIPILLIYGAFNGMVVLVVALAVIRPCLIPSSGSWRPGSRVPSLSPPTSTALSARCRRAAVAPSAAAQNTHEEEDGLVFTDVSVAGLAERGEPVGLGLLPDWGCCCHCFCRHPSAQAWLPHAGRPGCGRRISRDRPAGPGGPAPAVSAPFPPCRQGGRARRCARVHRHCCLSPRSPRAVG